MKALPQTYQILKQHKREDPVKFLQWYLKENKEKLTNTFFSRALLGSESSPSDRTCTVFLFDRIPEEIMIQIVQYLSIEDLVRLSSVNSFFHWFINQGGIWKQRLRPEAL